MTFETVVFSGPQRAGHPRRSTCRAGSFCCCRLGLSRLSLGASAASPVRRPLQYGGLSILTVVAADSHKPPLGFQIQGHAVLCRVASVLSGSLRSDVAHQAPLPTGCSRKDYWSGLPFPPPGDCPNPGIKPASLKSPALAGGIFTTIATWKNSNPLATRCKDLTHRKRA